MNSAPDLMDGFAPHTPDQTRRYRDAGVFDDRPLWALLTEAVASTPEAPAVTDAGTGTTMTFRELLDAADQQAAGYLEAGLRPGDRVVLQLPNTMSFAVGFFALLRAGIVPVMALPAHRIGEIAHLATASGARAYIGPAVHAGFDYRDLAGELVDSAPTVEHVFIAGDPGRFRKLPDSDSAFTAPAVDPSAPALLLVSGGTTGLPKLIARTHDDYRYNARRSAAVTSLSAADVFLAALPAAHNFPLCCPGLLGAVAVGAHTVLTTDPSPDAAFQLIETYQVTVCALVPTLAQLWCAATEWEAADISSLRLLQVGGARLSAADAAALDRALGPVVQQVFGMAEGLICYTRLDDSRETVHSCQGMPMSELDEIRVVGPDGSPVADGEEGELLVRGPYTIRGYYRAPEHSARSFTADGFYRSGDLVQRLPTGHLAVVGRIKDTIVRAGENVAADDVEEHLLAHPAVAQASVVGLPHDTLGESICAVIVPPRDADAPSLRDVRRFLRDRGLATFKLPDRVWPASTLPVTSVGKVDKTTLRAGVER